jgi:hypothetical protein
MSGDFEPPMRSLQAQNTLRKMVIQLIIYAASGSLVGLPLKATLDRRYSWRVRALRVVAFTLVLGALYIGIIALLEKSLTIIN